MKNKIAIGADHAGYKLKGQLISFLEEKGYVVTDFGCPSEESIDYPDYAHPVANIVEKEGGIGILICGSGNGISMSANKHSGIRCALCWTDEIAALARQHNDAKKYVDTFLSTEFEGGRHQRRVNKIACS